MDGWMDVHTCEDKERGTVRFFAAMAVRQLAFAVIFHLHCTVRHRPKAPQRHGCFSEGPEDESRFM